jgi:hypothetical protein
MVSRTEVFREPVPNRRMELPELSGKRSDGATKPSATRNETWPQKSASYVAYMENGRRDPSLTLLIRLARVLRMRPAKLALQAIPQLAEFGMK